jgi:hypothetical protein
MKWNEEKKYHTVGTVRKANRKSDNWNIVESGVQHHNSFSLSLTHAHTP